MELVASDEASFKWSDLEYKESMIEEEEMEGGE